MKKVGLFIVVFCASLAFSGLLAQQFQPFTPIYNSTHKGDMFLIGNSVLGVVEGGTDQNYNKNDFNNNNAHIELGYINIDSDGGRNFNSSSADVIFTNVSACRRVSKAYLYWSVAYTDRGGRMQGARFNQADFNKVRLKTPNNNYVDIVGEELYNGRHSISSTSDNPDDAQRAYVYFQDVTDKLDEKGNFGGTYTVANIQAPIGTETTGVGYAAGWSLFIVYEDNTLQSKNITLFNGFHAVNTNNNNLDIPVAGFKTVPLGPVRAKFAFTALEGEQGLLGDYLQMRGQNNFTTTIQVPGRERVWQRNPYEGNRYGWWDNFFNSTVTNENGVTTNRRPASKNLLGFDVGILNVPNNDKSLINNNDTRINLLPKTGGDSYYLFMTAFNVEVIEPKIIIEKKVFRGDEDLTGLGVERDNVLEYRLDFYNIGNDDATDLIIEDVLPANVNFENIAGKLPDGIQMIRLNGDRKVQFKVPDALVKKNQTGKNTVSFFVRVINDCDKFRDACSNIIRNTAYGSYLGKENPTTTRFEATSVKSFSNCGGELEFESNVIVDMQGCTINKNVELCGQDVTLTAGAGFEGYEWKDAGGNVLGTEQSVTVRQPGVYVVTKKSDRPECLGGTETFEVKRREGSPTHPIEKIIRDKTVAGEIFECANDGNAYPQIYLCGTNASVELIPDIVADKYEWQKRDEASCVVPNNYSQQCPVLLENCTWNTVKSEKIFNVLEAGDYRLRVSLQNGCVQDYYFKVTKKELDVKLVFDADIECESKGKVHVTGVGDGYEFRLATLENPTTYLTPWRRMPTAGGSTDNEIVEIANPREFEITEKGNYVVAVRQSLGTLREGEFQCIYLTNAVNIKVLDTDIFLTPTEVACEGVEGGKGSIRVEVQGASAPFHYKVVLANSPNDIVYETRTDTRDITIPNLNGSEEGINYLVTVDNEKCTLTKTTTIGRAKTLTARATVTRHLMCGSAEIQVSMDGGTIDTTTGYSVLRHDTNESVSVISTKTVTFTVDEAKTYTFTVTDLRGCTVIVEDTVKELPVLTFTTTTTLRECGKVANLNIAINETHNYTVKYKVGDLEQSTSTFLGLIPGGTYEVGITYTLGNQSCTVTDTVTLSTGDGPITAGFAGVSELIGCGTDPANNDKAKVRVTNVQGGTKPYEYSFDNKQIWISAPEGWMSPGKDLSVFVRDINGCEYEMKVTIDDAPTDPVFTSDVAYDCEGKGTITIGNDQPRFDYTYSIGGGTATTTNVFSELEPGKTYTITIQYSTNDVPTPSVLFLEDFGVGTNKATTPYINKAYFFEPQTRTRGAFGVYEFFWGTYGIRNGNGENQYIGNAPLWWGETSLNDGEYTIATRLDPNNGAWYVPNDHTRLNNGRMLFVNVGSVLGAAGGILYQREMKDIIPNREIKFSIAVTNLLYSNTNSNADPSLVLELYDSEEKIASNRPLRSVAIGVNGRIPANRQWNEYEIGLDPGNNTTLFAVVRSNSLIEGGNDLALDDIYLYQMPKICPFTRTISVKVEADKAFGIDTSSEQTKNNICSGGSKGSYSISLYNFDTTNGYYVSKNGGNWEKHTTNPFKWENLEGTKDGKEYTIKFRYSENSTNCEFTRTFNITSPDPIVLNDIDDQVLPCNPNNVSVRATANGGTGALTYTLTQPDNTTVSNNTGNFASLTQTGTYTVSVTDANGCPPVTTTFDVIDAPAITLALDDPTSQHCYTPATPAEAGVTVTGGTAPYTYIINGVERERNSTSTSYVFRNLQPNTYVLVVRDANGCEATVNYTVFPEFKTTVSTIEKQITCEVAPNNEGRIQITLAGGEAPYTYTVNGGTDQNVTGTTITYSTATPTTYTFVIKDNRGCELTRIHELVAPTPPTITFASQVNIKCYGESTGSFTVNANNGVTPYTYIVNGVDRGRQNVFNNLPAGTYTVTVRDAYNCEVTDTITLTQPTQALSATTQLQTLISCSPAQDTAEVILTVTGGTAPYTDSATGGSTTYTSTRTISLRAGTHNIRITDANNCWINVTVTVPQRPERPVIATPAVTYDCEGKGSFTITPANTTDYEYEYTFNGITNTTGIFTEVAAGQHRVEVRYRQVPNPALDPDCGYTMIVPVRVAGGQEFTIGTPQTTPVTCFNGTDGKVTVNVSNFDTTHGFRYSIDNGVNWTPATTSPITINNLSEGTAYNLKVEYANADGTFACTKDVPFVITQPTKVSGTATVTTPLMCSNTGATITVSASGGTAGYTYSIDGGNFQSSNIFPNVSSGTHTITIRDRNNCESDPITIEVDAPKTVSITTSTAECYSGKNDGTITVNVTDGNGNYRFSINNGAWAQANPATPTTHTFTGLSDGTYTIRVQDGFGCSTTTSVIIHPELVVNTSSVNISCKDGSISTTATGGDGTYTYAFVISGVVPVSTDYGTASTYTVTATGSYDVYVTDGVGCVRSKTVTITQAPAVAHTAQAVNPACFGGKGSVNITNIAGDGPYTLKIENQTNAGVGDMTITDFVGTTYSFLNLSEANYKVTVTDRYGCEDTSLHTITELPEITVTMNLITGTCASTNQNEFGVHIEVPQTIIDAYTAAGYELQYSIDGTTWGTTATFTGYDRGDRIRASIRTVKTGENTTICLNPLDVFEVPFQLSELTLTNNLITGQPCSSAGFSVTVTASGGIAPYEFTMGNPNDASTVWYPSTGAVLDRYTFTGLTPGRSYEFYVKDLQGCIERNKTDIYDGYDIPVVITPEVTPACFGTTTGSINFNVVPTPAHTGGTFTYIVYEVNPLGGAGIPTTHTGSATMPVIIPIANLQVGKFYYMEITEASGCKWASKSAEVYVLTELGGTPRAVRDITCSLPGLVTIDNPIGGGGTYQYELRSAAFNNPIAWTSDVMIEVPISNIIAGTTGAITVGVFIRDQYQCEKKVGEVTLNVAAPPTITSVTPNSCTSDLSITVVASPNASTAYRYSIDGGTNWLDNGGVFSGLTAGTYTVSVQDKETGCVVSTNTTTTLHPQLKAEVKQNDLLTCNGTVGSIEINVTQGSGNYAYAVTGKATVTKTDLPNNKFDFTISTDGVYTITVYDKADESCPLVFGVEIPKAVKPFFTAISVDATCHGGNDGRILIAETDTGVGTYTYTLTPAGTYSATTGSFEGLSAGAYIITSTGANGCIYTDTITVGQATAVTTVTGVVTVTEFACTAGNTMNEAKVSVDLTKVSGGTGQYQYQMVYDNGTPADTTDDVTVDNTPLITTNAKGGEVKIVIKDTKGCEIATPITQTIKSFDELKDIKVNPTVDIICGGTETVDVVVTTALSEANKLRYIKSKTTPAADAAEWQTSKQFTGLDVGFHTFWVKHTDTGCMTSTTHEVKEPNTFAVGEPKITAVVKCVGEKATAVFTLINTVTYTGVYNYEVLNGTTVSATGTATNGVITVNLAKGDYVLKVTQVDNPKCEQRRSFKIDEPKTTLSATTQVSQITCESTTNGSIEVINANGGWGEYTYYVGTNNAPTPTDFVANPLFGNLGVNTYHVFIRDKEGCEVQLPDVTLALPDLITATLSITTQNCVANSGVIEVLNTQGGQGSGYSYQLIKDGANYGAPQSGTVFSDLSSGTYQVYISDGWGCTETITTSVELFEPLTVTPEIKVTKEITCTVPTQGEIEIIHTGGSTAIDYTVTNADGSYNQTQQRNNTFTGLTPGSYTVTLFDTVTGCPTVTTQFTLEDTIAVGFTHTQTNVSCKGNLDGTIAVTIPATNTQVPYTVVLSSTSVAGFVSQTKTATTVTATIDFTGLGAGNYDVTVTSSRGCFATQPVQITEPDALTISSTTTSATAFACNTVNVPQVSVLTVVAEGGTLPYHYSIDGVDYSNDTGTFIIYDTGATQTITVYVKDKNGCPVDNSANPIVIQPLPKITKVDVVRDTAITCNNAETVSLTITGGANNGYTIDVTTTANLVTPIPQQTLPAGTNVTQFTLLEPGQYNFTITDNETGCYTSTTYVIDTYNTIKATATMSSTVSCVGSSDGEISLTVTDYTGAFTYELFHSDGVTPLTTVPRGNGNTTVTNTVTISNAPAGNWIVRVTATDTPFCSTDSGVVFVVEPTVALTASATLTSDLTCVANTAQITASAEGGWGGYEYRLLDGTTPHAVYGTYTTTTNFVGLGAGNYTVQVRDAGKCEAKTAKPIILTPPTRVSGDIEKGGEIKCKGDETAFVEVKNVNGGSGKYTYALVTATASGTIESATQTSTRFEGLGEGNYSIKIYDGWNCDDSTETMTINGPTRVTVTAKINTNITCTIDKAVIELEASGGTGTYTYSDSPTGTFTTDNTFTVGVGSHTFYAKDANGCLSEVSNTIVINPIEPLDMIVDTTNAYVTCNGSSTASIRATASGGLGNYTYELLDDTGASFTPQVTNTDGAFGGLASGTYQVKVTSEDCEMTYLTAITINEAPALITDTATSTNVTCNGENDGTIEVLVTGGTGSITYAISPRLDRFEAKNKFEELEPGAYTVLAQDENGCFATFHFDITEPDPLDITAGRVTPELCLGAADGTVTVTITGGTAPYRTSLNSTDIWVEGKVFYDNLPAGTGNVILVKDANDCEDYVVLPEVNAGVDLKGTVTVTYDCAGTNVIKNNIKVTVNPDYKNNVTYTLEGTKPEYKKGPILGNQPGGGHIFQGVATGTYTVTVTHNNGCKYIKTVEVKEKKPLTFDTTIEHVSCFGAADGMYTIYVYGGSGNYEYAIRSNTLSDYDSSNQFSNLKRGKYTVIVKDIDYKCETSDTFTINEPTQLGLTLSKANESCYGQKDGSISFEITGSVVSGTTTTYSYKLVNSKNETVRELTDIGANQSINEGSLEPDTYTLSYNDNKLNYRGPGREIACSGTETITIEPAPNLLPTAVNLKYECPTVLGNAPTNYLEVVFDESILTMTNTLTLANTTYMLNGTNSATAVNFTEFNRNTAIIRDLPKGTDQYITIFHNGCQKTISNSHYFDVEEYDPLSLRDVSDPTLINQINVEARGGATPYEFYFNETNQGNKGEYFIRRNDPGYVDANGRNVKQIAVTVVDLIGCQVEINLERVFIDVRIPDHFTPNSDGNNDTWQPENTRNYPNIDIKIYDRYGRVVATLRQGQSWDGRYNSKPLPTGDYWYVIRLNEDEDDSREFIGHFSLYR